MAITDFERYPLTFGPSPVHELKRLSDHLGGARVWTKREDVNSGLAFGGNKTRKLEYIVPDILASGADTLVSIGGYQSNHTRQVAAVAAHLGLKSRLVQERWVDWDDPVNDKVGNIELSRIMGADVHLDSAGFDIGIRSSWENAIAEVEAAGGRPYPIPAGASEHKFGALGFVNWAYEVAEQEKDLGVFFDTIIVCTVTGSTHAGMIAGFAALEAAGGPKRQVIGIDASATLGKTRDQVKRIANNAAGLIGLGREITDADVDIRAGWEGPAYGIPDDSTVNAIRTTAELEGVILDPVYEGKSMAGLLDLVGQDGVGGRAGVGDQAGVGGQAVAGSRGAVAKDSTVLYAHLGGQLALNAYSSIF